MRAPWPLKGAARRRDRAIDIGRVAFGDGGDDLLGGGIEGLEGAPGDGWDMLAVDQQQAGLAGEIAGTASRE